MDRLNNWLKTLFEEFNDYENTDEVQRIMKKCGSNCAKDCGMHEIVAKMKEEIRDISDFTEVLATIKSNLGEGFEVVEGGFIAEFGDGKCVCPLVSGQYINSPVLCNCTRGFNESVWSNFFDRPVKVELLQTVLRGGNTCKIKVLID